jgi:branched-chain amino acid transport system permease protein
VDFTFFFNEVVNGLSLGSVYALIALGYSMVYGILKLLNFAHGEIFMMGAFAGFGVLSLMGGPGDLGVPVGVGLALMFLGAMAVSGFIGVTVERFAYRPLRDAPRIAPLISALGVSFFLQNVALLLFGADIRSYDTPKLVGLGTNLDIGGVHIWLVRILVIVLSVVLMIALWLLVGRTGLGRAMRATAYDREAAAMMGVNVDRVIVWTFFIGSALAGAGGVMFGLMYGGIYNLMGFGAGLKAFIAAVIGGIGNIPGAMLGGLLLGLSESLVTAYVSSTFKDAIVFVILIVVMLLRPSGLLGSPAIQKV